MVDYGDRMVAKQPSTPQYLEVEPPASWQHPLAPLDYPGNDELGTAWREPPADRRCEKVRRDHSKPAVIEVLGSSGFKASWQAGVAEVVEDLTDVVRYDLASGGTVPGLAAAAGIPPADRRRMNAGAPSREFLRPVEGLRWWERKNFDLAGRYDNSEVETWLGKWLAWAGVKTFRDLRYERGEPHPAGVSHRAGISIVMWKTKKAFPYRCTPEQLADPEFIHKAFRWAYFGRQFPLKQFKQVWVPDNISRHLPWLAGEIEDHSPASWAKVSMAQWPACVPTLLQDPETLQLVFLADGGHIDNQPSLFNDGAPKDFPLINPRLMQSKHDPDARQRLSDVGRMPFGSAIRFPRTPSTTRPSLKGDNLTWMDRDAMLRDGVLQGRERLPAHLTALVNAYPSMVERHGRLGRDDVVDVPLMHGFQALAGSKRSGTNNVFSLRS